jgi:hypothetical protein
MDSRKSHGIWQNNIYVLHRLQQAFDCLDHSRLRNTLGSMGVPEQLMVLIKRLYTKQEAAVRTEYGNTEWFEVRKGDTQGCILSPYLLNMYSKYILRRVGFEDNTGRKVGGGEHYKQFAIFRQHHNISRR